MLLNVRSTAISIAVICFFAISFITWLGGLAPFTCCKRAIAGALLAYLAAALAVKAVNAIVISAMVENQMKQQKEQDSGGEN